MGQTYQLETYITRWDIFPHERPETKPYQQLKIKGRKKIYQPNTYQKKAGTAMRILDKIEFVAKIDKCEKRRIIYQRWCFMNQEF